MTLSVFLVSRVGERLQSGPVGFLVESFFRLEDVVHFLAEAEGDLRLRFGFLHAELDQPGEGFRDVGGLRGNKLLLHGGEQVGEKVVVHGV